MHQPQIHTFQESLDISEQLGGGRHLMLGNGFSCSIFPNIFNYKALADRINSKTIKSLFSSLKTHDFEDVMRRITNALIIARLYPEGSKFTGKLEQDLEELKNTLIDVITISHPPTPQAISENEYQSCYNFLKHFEKGKKYSFNYDLILYWVYMHFLENKEKPLVCDDGFRKPEGNQSIVQWRIGREISQTIYYLHGAMHIFNDGSSHYEKYTWINSGISISEQVRESISSQKYPVFISEGTTEQKLLRIMENTYLGRAFASLKSIRGSLFIFGHSIRDEDDHVFNFINEESKGLKNIFISLFGDINSPANQKIINKIEGWKHKYIGKNYYFYDACSANVWNG
ncbi:TPA: DUF4917 family protein [Legionella pneumophila]|uniref:DUF4917 family protein n=1 Tax=Legionella pneumophila TaxID=446 RepID=UPI0004812E9A|nr:DUF4917 family protein [Legionella pneumophila]HAT9118347.1 DUF4917 family protein [Legionella pneumophila subsp. pneumophila]MCH9094723.1 DUF4917 family protein [Legionella pneumophila serogroup 1]MCH9136574.1 DUF4917 family protein [Legionella pneumophila serogroup 1]MCH9139558.1 DUF4917 family protein [Legionella pneumophila serogroup 1]MCH9166670.1 DUF4917 family protein [Legionella pneumophila serogroup 1]